MLMKLIKHDIISTKRDFYGIYLALLIVSLIAPFIIHNGPEWLAVIAMFGVIGVVIAIVIMTFVTIVKLYVRRLYSFEGYLTWTLPATTEMILTSKILVGMFWTVVSYLVVTLGLFIFVMVLSLIVGGVGPEFGVIWGVMIDSGFVGKLLMAMLYGIPHSLVNLVYSMVLLLLVITIVNTSMIKKAKVGVGILLYIGVSLLLTQLLSLFIKVEPLSVWVNENVLTGVAIDPVNALYQFFSSFTITYNWLSLVGIVVYYILWIVLFIVGTVYLIEHKIELE